MANLRASQASSLVKFHPDIQQLQKIPQQAASLEPEDKTVFRTEHSASSPRISHSLEGFAAARSISIRAEKK
jgi:hypothetical protein